MFKITHSNMNNIQSTFSIKDLENLSGIKAHTIRIWEKRYNLFQPERTDSNIRYYHLESLQMLLNVSYLNENGYKISKIAALPKGKAAELVKKIAAKDDSKNPAFLGFKLAMLNFDQQLFYRTYNSLSKEKSFREIFYDIFIPLLSEIGVLWQTDTITPAHEHFISTLIRQKIISKTEQFQSKNNAAIGPTFVLFLPDNEIHELGLLYLNLEIIAKGYHSIMLGPSVPISSLVDLIKFYGEITFISYFTIKPEKAEILKYLVKFEKKLLIPTKNKFWILGKMLQYVDTDNLTPKIKTFSSISSLVDKL